MTTTRRSWHDRTRFFLGSGLTIGTFIFLNYGFWMSSASMRAVFPLDILSGVSNFVMNYLPAVGFIGFGAYVSRIYDVVGDAIQRRIPRIKVWMVITALWLVSIFTIFSWTADLVNALFRLGGTGWIAVQVLYILGAQPVLVWAWKFSKKALAWIGNPFKRGRHARGRRVSY